MLNVMVSFIDVRRAGDMSILGQWLKLEWAHKGQLGQLATRGCQQLLKGKVSGIK